MGSFFSSTPSFDPETDTPDLSGRVIIVTGGNSGIGYQTILRLVTHGNPTIYMASRNESKATGAIRKLEEELSSRGLRLGTKNVGTIKFLKCELASPTSAKAAALEFLSKESRLDILINNAGALTHPFTLGPDGISDVMATNHLGTFAFTTTLLPLLIKTSETPGTDVRIVTVASEAHRFVSLANIKFDTVSDFNIKIGEGGMADLRRYGVSKLTNVLFNIELQRRLDEAHVSKYADSSPDSKSPIIAVSLHPGSVHTDGFVALLETFPVLLARIWALISFFFFLSAEKGALTTLFAATSKEVRDYSNGFRGGYLVPYGKLVESAPSQEGEKGKELARNLWNLTEETIEAIGEGKTFA